MNWAWEARGLEVCYVPHLNEPIRTSRCGHPERIRIHFRVFIIPWTKSSLPIEVLIPFSSSSPTACAPHGCIEAVVTYSPWLIPVAHQAYATSMPSPNLLQQLHSLDRSSPGFSNQLKGFLLGEDCVNHAQDLPCEVLGPFVEYLDNVRLLIAFFYSLLNIVVGSQRPRPYRSRLLPLLI
jgi:hypothetical protein